MVESPPHKRGSEGRRRAREWAKREEDSGNGGGKKQEI